MATRIEIKLNHDGITELLSSDAVGAVCKQQAEAIASRAGDGFEVWGPQKRGGNRKGGSRVGYGVIAETYEAKLAEATFGVLSKAVR